MSESSKENEVEDPFKLRPYQDQLLEIALKENVIIYLPTGAGKTYIALMAMREMSHQLQGSIKDGAKRSVFLCNTIVLAKQQCDVIKEFTNLKVSVYTGDLNVDNWRSNKWQMEFETNQVIVATVQIVVDVIRHGYISITDLNLIIFDECHHAKGDHPMFQLMSQFKNHPRNKLPRVIGLTGLLITPTSVGAIEKDLYSLEATYHGRIVTVENLNEFRNVLVYSTKPRENVIEYISNFDPPRIHLRVEALVNECINIIQDWKIDETHERLTKNLQTLKSPNPIKKVINLLRDFLYQMNDMGLYAGRLAILSVIIEIEIKKRAAETTLLSKMLNTALRFCECILHLMTRNMYDEDDEMTEEEVLLTNSTPKLLTFIRFLEQTFIGKDVNDIKCLIFVKRRHTAKCLYHVIKYLVGSNSKIPIIPEFMTGNSSASLPESIEQILETKWNKNVLCKFKKNECNLIVCSNVLEEGIDVQSCNHVIMFDKIETYGSYVQSKGRARKEDSYFTVMVPSREKVSMLRKIIEYREIDAALKNFLIGKTIDRKPPLQEEIDKTFESDIQPFYTSTGARLDGSSVLQLLNRYCMMLPNDSFTLARVEWKRIDEAGYIYVKLLLPIQSAIKDEIMSDPKKIIKLAKQSAAFKACKALYDIGEINENLLPISKVKREEIVTPLYFKHWKNYPNDNNFAGTRKNRRLYSIEHSRALQSALPLVGEECFLYAIKLTPCFQADPDNQHLIDLFSLPGQYAILTRNSLPKLAEMPLFMTDGEVRVKISRDPVKIRLTEDDTYLRNFHVMVFQQLLKIRHCFLARDYSNKENSFFIVPTLNGKEINWNLVKRFQSLSTIKEPSEMQRAKYKYNPDDYNGNIIYPWYNADTTIRYVVTKVRTDLTPMSPFPDAMYKNFSEYIYSKYNARVVQSNQFMLLAKPITSRINFLTFHNTKKKKVFDEILLIPELCHNFHFPGDMYLKARFLPSILHRIHYMLLAEEIRCKINTYLGLEFPNYEPKPLVVDTALARVAKEQEKVQASRPMIYSSKELEPKIITEPKSIMLEASQCDWKEYEEPCDLTRNLTKMYSIELDYYHQFITDKLNSLSLSDKKASEIEIMSSIDDKKAICDVPTDERLHIGILEISEAKNSVEQSEFLSAITASSTADVFDMERIEVLGDSYLKLSISLFLLYKHPIWNEGHLTQVKGKFVSNRNLLYCAINMKLPGCLNVSLFSPENDWVPPLISLPRKVLELIESNNVSPNILWGLELNYNEIQKGECDDETLATLYSKMTETNKEIDNGLNVFINKQAIADKTCADSMEAILGVCVKNYGVKKTFSILEYMGIIPSGSNVSNLLNVNLGNPRLKENIPDQQIDAFIINYQSLEQKLGYKFNDRAYLLQALTHPSYPSNRLTGCYQQLEFIGDAILDFLITSYIFERCSNMDPGKLTDLRSSLVNNVTLACIAVRNGFHLFMLSQNAGLLQSIQNFVTFQKKQNNKITDQVRILIQEDEKQPFSMADYVDVPKALGDVFEALIGAVFFDSKNDLKVVWRVIYNLMQSEINEFMANVPLQIVRQLYEYHGANPQFSPPEENNGTTMVTCTFTCRDKLCEVFGFGKNKDQARIASAKIALQTLLQS